MVSITALEVHLDDATFSIDEPFKTSSGSGEAGDETDELVDDEQADSDDEGPGVGVADGGSPVPTRALAIVGAVLVLVGVAAALRRFIGGEDPEVDIETPDDENRPVGVTVDE